MCAVVASCLLSVPSWAEAPVAVKVRGGIHERFNRIVLDWPGPVKYTMQQKDGNVTIQFTRPANLNLASFKAASPPMIRNLAYSNAAEGLNLSFSIPDGARVQAFWSGNNVAFDVLLMTPKKPADKPKDPPPATATKTQDPPPADKQPTDKPSPSEAAPQQQPATRFEDDSSGPQTAQILPGLPDKPVDQLVDEINRANAPEESAPTAAPAPANPEPVQANPYGRTLADELADNNAKPVAQAKPTTINIRPLKKVGAAVFVRAGRLWMIFDQPLPDVLPQLTGSLADTMSKYTKVKSDKAAGFIFDLPDGVATPDIKVKKDGLSWVIRIQDNKSIVEQPSEFVLNVDSGNTLSLLTGQQASVLSFDDEALGDKLWVIPVQAPLLRTSKHTDTAVVIMLPTVVGGLLVPQQEGLNIIAKSNQILIQDLNNPLMLSSDADREKAEAQRPQQEKLFLLDLPDFPSRVKSFEAQRQYLEQQISKQRDKADKAVTVLDIARLYLRQGYGVEAEGALDFAQSYLPNLKKTPSYQALKGMAQALSGKVKPALKTLDSAGMEDSKLADIWRAYAYAQDKNWEKAFLGFRTQQHQMRSYPPEVLARLALMAAESAVETDNYKDANDFLNMVPKQVRLNVAQTAARDFMKASILSQSDNDVHKYDAKEILETLANGTDRYYRVKADMALLAINIGAKEIKNQDAIDTLERLRFAWRGDRQEIAIMQELAQYYLADQKPMDAMTIWRQALSLARNEADQKQIKADLQKQFDALFVEGGSKGMAPLQALALYHRFKDLMPQNEDGARAALQLSDQLLHVDLVDEADALMQEQINKQAAPEHMVAIGTKLATTRLIARNPAGAIKALDSSQQDGISADVQQRRTLLRARALADLQQTSQALALLQEPSVPEGLSLRADIFWRVNRWSDAAYDLQNLIETTPNKTAGNPLFVNLVMRLAIVKALQNDDMGLDQMNAQYGEMMAESPKAKVFQMMTTSLDGGGSLSDLETLKTQVADAELFETFLKDF